MMFTRRNRAIIVFLIAFLMIFSSLFSLSACAQDSAAIDLVIVLDNSASMKDRNPESDPKGYRYYAAATMLNMCESEKSRAAIIYFSLNTEVQTLANNKTVAMPVSIALRNADGSPNYIGEDNRNYYTDVLVERASGKAKGGTYLGTAVLKAVELLDTGAATRGDNQPIILVLADGQNEDADAANLEEAVRQAESKGYRIYPVLLKNSKNTDIDENANILYNQMATRTGGKALDPLENPSDLPRIFSEIFATQIGSSLATEQNNTTRVGEGKYKMEINIPNHSVLEANILMSLDGVENVRLTDPSGNSASPNVLRTPIGKDKYLLYKVLNPDVIGNWTLSFEAEPSALDGVKVNVLFSYNIDLRGDIQCVGSQTVYKNSQFILSAQFYDKNAPSTDTDLYTHGITATAYLLKQGEEITESTPSIELEPYGNRFEKTVTLEDFGLDTSGNYEVLYHAEGDGLIKDSPRVSLPIVNRSPVKISEVIPKVIPLSIENPNQQNINQPDTYALSVSDFVTDEDGDPLTMHLTCNDTTLITFKNVDNRAMTATLETAGLSGTTQVRISVQDPEGASLDSDIIIPITVTSIVNELRNAYSPKITMTTEPTQADTYEVNSQVDFTVVIYETQSPPAYDIDDYQAVVGAVLVKGNTATGQDVVIPLEQTDARSWRGSLTLDTRDEYPIQATIYAGANQTALTSTSFDIKALNYPPEPVQTFVEQTVYIEPIPLPLLRMEATQPYDIDLDTLFTDQNLYDTLTYSVTSDGQEVCQASLSGDGTKLSLQQFLQKGSQRFTLTALDTSDATAEMVLSVAVISYQQQALDSIDQYGPIVLAVILLIILLRWLVKPSFKQMTLAVFRDKNPYLAAIRLKKTKRNISLGIYADNVIIKDLKLSKPQLKSIQLKAGKNFIYVYRNKKSLDGAIVTVESVVFNKKQKKYILRNGGEICISNNNHTVRWQLGINRGNVPPRRKRRHP